VLPGWDWLSDEQLRDAGINQSATHIDFMVGGADVTVTGLHADGTQVPILDGGEWQLTGATT
jgi:aminopeptidase